MLSGITEKSWEESFTNKSSNKSPDSYIDWNLISIEKSE